MKEAGGWIGLIALGVILLVCGFTGRFGVLFAAVFAPQTIWLHSDQSKVGPVQPPKA